MDEKTKNFLDSVEDLADGELPTLPQPRERAPLILYISGPMSGLPGFNATAFSDAEHALRACGFEVFNPARNGLDPAAPWETHMRRDIAALTECRGVACLDGAHKSEGAKIEMRLARELGMPVLPLPFWLVRR